MQIEDFTARVLCRVLVEYAGTWLIAEMAISYKVAQDTRTPDSSFTFVVEQLFEMFKKSLSSEAATSKIHIQGEISRQRN